VSNNPLIVLIYIIISGVLSSALFYLFLRMTSKKKIKESFESSDITLAASGAAINTVYAPPPKLPKETCDALTTQIAQYLDVKEKNPDIVIKNLDETVEMLKKSYTDGKCHE
jgi:hypothetical protein